MKKVGRVSISHQSRQGIPLESRAVYAPTTVESVRAIRDFAVLFTISTVDSFDWVEPRKRVFYNGTMTHYQLTALQGGFVQGVPARVTQNSP